MCFRSSTLRPSIGVVAGCLLLILRRHRQRDSFRRRLHARLAKWSRRRASLQKEPDDEGRAAPRSPILGCKQENEA